METPGRRKVLQVLHHSKILPQLREQSSLDVRRKKVHLLLRKMLAREIQLGELRALLQGKQKRWYPMVHIIITPRASYIQNLPKHKVPLTLESVTWTLY